MKNFLRVTLLGCSLIALNGSAVFASKISSEEGKEEESKEEGSLFEVDALIEKMVTQAQQMTLEDLECLVPQMNLILSQKKAERQADLMKVFEKQWVEAIETFKADQSYDNVLALLTVFEEGVDKDYISVLRAHIQEIEPQTIGKILDSKTFDLYKWRAFKILRTLHFMAVNLAEIQTSKTLDLHNQELDDRVVKILAHFAPELKGLTVLNLGNNRFTPECAGDLSVLLSALKDTLAHLNINCLNKLGAAGTEALLVLCDGPLEKLNLSGSVQGGAGALAKLLPTLQHLKKCDVSHNAWGEKKHLIVSALQGFKGDFLDLTWTRMGNDFIACAPIFASMPALKDLSLWGNCLYELSADQIKTLEPLKNITSFDLGCNVFGGRSDVSANIPALQALLGLVPNVQDLCLANNHLSDAQVLQIVPDLQGLKSLTALGLYSHSFSDATKAQLREALPGVKISF